MNRIVEYQTLPTETLEALEVMESLMGHWGFEILAKADISIEP